MNHLTKTAMYKALRTEGYETTATYGATYRDNKQVPFYKLDVHLNHCYVTSFEAFTERMALQKAFEALKLKEAK